MRLSEGLTRMGYFFVCVLVLRCLKICSYSGFNFDAHALSGCLQRFPITSPMLVSKFVFLGVLLHVCYCCPAP